MLLYASEHEDRLPQSMEEIRTYADSEEQHQWFLENVEYLGAGATVAQAPSVVVAYDKTLLATGKGTIVLFLDTHIEYVEPERFAKYGLNDGIEVILQKNAEMDRRAQSERCLNELGRSLRFYTHENDDRLPSSLEEIRKHINRGEQYQWIVENVEYLGAGLLFSQSPSLVVAYDKTLLATGKGTNVLFLDNHVEFIEPERLAGHGLPAGPEK
jgi:prepilin-type processing-associated H-X9-DG protein